MRIREERGAPLTADGEIASGNDETVLSDETFPADPGNPQEHPAGLPTDPARLKQVLLGPDPAECAETEAYCLTQALKFFHQSFVLEQDLQAALIRTLLGAEDIAYAGSGRDRLGRAVEVFVVDDPDRTHQYLVLFDGSSGAYAVTRRC